MEGNHISSDEHISALRLSSTKKRISALQSLREALQSNELDEEHKELIVLSLFRICPIYQDRLSRHGVQQCLAAAFKASADCLDYFSHLLARESERKSLSASNLLTLIEWVSLAIQSSAKQEDQWSKSSLQLLKTSAVFLDSLLSRHSRPSRKDFARKVIGRALQQVFRADGRREGNVITAVHDLASQATLGQSSIPLLGVIAGVCQHLTNAEKHKLSPYDELVKSKKTLYQVWIREVLGAKVKVAEHIADGYANIWTGFLTEEDIEVEILPFLEKALLRAPEVILNNVLRRMITSFSSQLDLSQVVFKNLLRPLVSSFKSTNATVRSGALQTLTVLLLKCENTESIAQELSRDLLSSKIAAADQRCLYAESIAYTRPSVSNSRKLSEGLAALASREQNENALAAELSALTSHSLAVLEDGSGIPENVSNAILKGISDKKGSVQRLWTLCCGNLLWQMTESLSSNSDVISLLIDKLLLGLLEQIPDIEKNAIQAAQGGAIVCTYILMSLVERLSKGFTDTKGVNALHKAEFLKRALLVIPRPSFFLSFKVYTKLSSHEDQIWFVRALKGCTALVCSAKSDLRLAEAWIHAYLWVVCCRNIKHDIQQSALRDLSQSYRLYPNIVSTAIGQASWSWYWDLKEGIKETAAGTSQTGMKRVHLLLNCICQPTSAQDGEQSINDFVQFSDEELQLQLINLLVLCHEEIVPRSSWIRLCLQAKQDPGQIVHKKSFLCLEHIKAIVNSNDMREKPDQSVYLASYATFAELAFVDGSGFTPLLLQTIESDLMPSELSKYTPEDFAIARTPEGIVFVDVLSSKTQKLDKAAIDYDTEKWERELREQIAAKKGQQKNLTPAEQALVQTQLGKESAIRKEVLKLRFKLQRGIGIITALATGPPTDVTTWLNESLCALRTVIENGSGLVIGNSAESAYILCSALITSRLGSIRQSIGVSTMRAIGSLQLPENLLEEPLQHQITRVLYRLRLAGEHRPFDTKALIYIMPLLFMVLSEHGIGTSDTDSANEQVTLALEFLSYHGDMFTDPSLPRSQLLGNLIFSLQDFALHYRLVKEVFNDVCRAISKNYTPKERQKLLEGTVVSQATVRNTVLYAIREYIDLTDIEFDDHIWLSCHDDDKENSDIANDIWRENGLDVETEDLSKMLIYLDSTDKQLRRAAARSLADFVRLEPDRFDILMDNLQRIYLERNKPMVPQKDRYGMVKKTEQKDPWESRNGVAFSFSALAPIFSPSRLPSFVHFLIYSGPLGDRSPEARQDMIVAAAAIITAHGDSRLEKLMEMFEGTLNLSREASSQSDLVNEATIILYGALARHLRDGDHRVPKVVTRLLQTLKTPSETVQFAVAECLPPLVRTSLYQVPEYVRQLSDELIMSESYAVRRGAAYGLAGIVQGKGVRALKEFRIMALLKSATEDKKSPNKREAAMMAYEVLSLIMGKRFEPYVIHIVPQLITGFGDASAGVREACLDASKVCFSSLSSYGVKVILPDLLGGLEEDQWRSKRGACDLLGSMAYLDPQQLAFSLPAIIPPLTNVLNDTHKEVRAAANRSLQRFGDVISNPEVKSLVGILLKALSDPTKYTDEALDALIKVNFVHYLDAPSLALVVRILGRGLEDRSTTKRKSAQIIGSLAHLTERKDLLSHLPLLVAGLRVAVVDPVPTTRATASKALGSLMEKLGEDALPDLIPSLMSTLKSDTGAGDRLGSAQALSEVLAGLGTGRLEGTLPTIMQNISSSKPSIREGFMSLFIFLPACFGNSFASYLSKIIPPILGGLADEVESIRETALRAGRLIVKNFANKAIDLLLPELDRGLADDNYRIRLSSVELVGDLLFNLTGISARQEAEDDDSGAAEAGQSLLEALGEERRNKVLSLLFICRNDTSGLVRSAAINVWKALVASPRTLKELVPTLSQLLIRRLASSNMEHKVIAGNALGELIRKSGESVLSTLLPSLEQSLQKSTDVDERQGICIALREIISAASPEPLGEYEKILIAVVRAALVDQNSQVRETAAEAFDSLQHIIGKRAVDQVLPYLLTLLRNEDNAETALGALLTLLTDNTRSNVILPNLMPTLMTTPMTAFNARAIASLSQVAGDAFVRRLSSILNALTDSIVGSNNSELCADLESAFDTVLASVDEYDGLNTAMSIMLTLLRHEDHERRVIANTRLSRFFANSDIDFSRYNQDFVRALLLSFDDRDSNVVKAAWNALAKLVDRLRKEEMENLVVPTRQVLQQVGVAGTNLPGFCLPKGIGSVLKLFTQGLMNGTTEQRIQSALALSDIVDRTSTEGLKPYVTNITGPLIRVVSEKSTELRAAILFTLNNLLEKVPLFLRPFLPQLQRTFAKSLSDTSSEVLRSRAAKALGTLLNLKPRVDPLVAELVTGAKTADEGVRTAMFKALFEVVRKAGDTMSETSRNSILNLIDGDSSGEGDTMIITNARLLGTLVRVLPPDTAIQLIKQRALTAKFSLSSILCLNSVLLEAHDILMENFTHETPSIISQGIAQKSGAIAENAVLAAGKLLIQKGPALPFEDAKAVVEALSDIVTPGNTIDCRRLGLVVVRTVARVHPDVTKPHLSKLAPAIFTGVRDLTIPVKLAAEAAFVSIFSIVSKESVLFDKYIAAADLTAQQKKSMQDYFKRVALRLANQARERADAEGGQGGLGLSSDEREDEREIMSIGKVELANVFAPDD